MLVLVDLFKFEVIVTLELGVASSHRVGSFQQVISKIAVAGFNHSGMLCLEVTRLVSVPDKTGKLGNRGLGFKAVNIANFSDNTGRVNLSNTGDGCQSVRNNFKLLFNGLIQYFDLPFQCAHGSNRNSYCLVYSVVHCLGQTVRPSGRSSYRLGSSIRSGKSATACFGDKGSQLLSKPIFWH